MKTNLQLEKKILSVDMKRGGDRLDLDLGGRVLSGEILSWRPPYFKIKLSGKIAFGAFFRGPDYVDIHLPEGNFRLNYGASRRAGFRKNKTSGGLNAPMPGKVQKIMVKMGDPVKVGDAVMILEAMKMEHKIISPQKGIVKKIYFQEGDRVTQGVELLDIKP